jgi:hypothetical protein
MKDMVEHIKVSAEYMSPIDIVANIGIIWEMEDFIKYYNGLSVEEKQVFNAGFDEEYAEVATNYNEFLKNIRDDYQSNHYSKVSEKIDMLKGITILQFAQALEHGLTNELVHEDTSLLKFLENYLNEMPNV